MKIILQFGSQKVIIDTIKQILMMNLETAFYKAGKQFSWEGNTVGLGVSKEILDYALLNNFTIAIQIGENPAWFTIHAKDFADFIEKHKSIWKSKDGKEICVIQWSKLKKVEEK